MTTVHSHSVQLLTVRDIAKRIRRDGEDLEAVVNRLRNWTKEGLLEFSGDKHPGTGRTRLYPKDAVIDALVLNALTAIGIPAVRAGGAKPYAGVFSYGRNAWQDFPKREAAGEVIFLVVFGAEGGSVFDGVGDNPHRCTLIYAPDSRDLIIPAARVDLSIPAAWGDATLLLNLTNLFRRLQKRLQENANEAGHL
jgi:hypothetical protein